ncbi:hypothetical protein UFOVP1608_53 [uncultured Caudovirales phage]|uniref:Uncharacterized protein n=1 Tax=uncultured Caudovirales phage TaxID=2100421 RepID=A0A6J5SUZ0_9CAUD|nr:hypothetical protein UFOVP1608_53 [uncultured Caudovirales phage]
MSLRDLAQQIAVLTVMEDTIKARKDAIRAALSAELAATGADATSAFLNDEKIAKVSLAGGKYSAKVVDAKAFEAWVMENHPDEILITSSVRSSFTDAVLKEIVATEAHLDPHFVFSSKTGEIVPGVTFVQGSAYVSTRFESGGRDRVLDALRDGSLAINVAAPLELEAGE